MAYLQPISEKTQKTPKGKETPVPKRKDSLKKLKKSGTLMDSAPKARRSSVSNSARPSWR